MSSICWAASVTTPCALACADGARRSKVQGRQRGRGQTVGAKVGVRRAERFWRGPRGGWLHRAIVFRGLFACRGLLCCRACRRCPRKFTFPSQSSRVRASQRQRARQPAHRGRSWRHQDRVRRRAPAGSATTPAVYRGVGPHPSSHRSRARLRAHRQRRGRQHLGRRQPSLACRPIDCRRLASACPAP